MLKRLVKEITFSIQSIAQRLTDFKYLVPFALLEEKPEKRLFIISKSGSKLMVIILKINYPSLKPLGQLFHYLLYVCPQTFMNFSYSRPHEDHGIIGH